MSVLIEILKKNVRQYMMVIALAVAMVAFGLLTDGILFQTSESDEFGTSKQLCFDSCRWYVAVYADRKHRSICRIHGRFHRRLVRSHDG